ncbi:MAG: glycosyltransferase family 4 protein [Pirellulaceae bacterium]
MRIMEICSGAGVNGAANTCLQNILALLDRGHHVTLVCRPNAWIAEQLADTTGPLEIVESELSRWPLHELRRIAALFFDRQHDVAHTHMSRANFFGVLLRRIFGVPCIATANNRYIQGHWMLNDHVLAASAATGRFHHRFNLVPNRKITVVHNFVEPTIYDGIQPDESSALRREWNVAADSLLIGCLGDMIPRKGLLHLIGALPLIKQQIPNVCVAALDEKIRNTWLKFKRKSIVMICTTKSDWSVTGLILAKC